MGIEVYDRGAAPQDHAGQPMEGSNGEVPRLEATPGADTQRPPVADPAVPPAEPAAATPAAVDIDPETLRQITTLTKERRELTRKLAEAEKKAAPDPELTAKLARLQELEDAMVSPRKYMALAKKTLEDVAADVLNGADEVHDPRVDALVLKMEAEAKARGESEATRKAKEDERDEQARAEMAQKATAHVQHVIANTKIGDELRWGMLAKDKDAAAEAVRASIIIRDRDYKNPDGTYKPFDANELLMLALDEGEELLAYRQWKAENGANGQSRAAVTQPKGIVVNEVDERPRPKPTIGPERGSTRSSPTARGPTDVRTARARMRSVFGKQ